MGGGLVIAVQGFGFVGDRQRDHGLNHGQSFLLVWHSGQLGDLVLKGSDGGYGPILIAIAKRVAGQGVDAFKRSEIWRFPYPVSVTPLPICGHVEHVERLLSTAQQTKTIGSREFYHHS